MSDYQKYKESHLKAQKKYDDKNREKKREYDKKRWQERKAKYQELEQLQQENKQLKDKLIEINEVINGYMPNQYAMCKAFDEIEFILSKEVE